MMIIIAPNSRAHKGGEGRRGEGGVWKSFKGNADYGGMVQASQQHVAPCVKRGSVGIGHERFETIGNIFVRHPRRGYTGGRRGPTL